MYASSHFYLTTGRNCARGGEYFRIDSRHLGFLLSDGRGVTAVVCEVAPGVVRVK